MLQTPVRDDLSDSLIHLTGRRNGVSPREALTSIIIEGRIRASGREGFIKGNIPAVCFTEAPFYSIPNIIDHRRNHQRPFGAFGIMLNKQAAWNIGARPVLYLPDNEGTWIPEDQKWRHVRFELPDIDFTHEREWRLPGELDLTQVDFLVIVKNSYHANVLLEELEQCISAEEVEVIASKIKLVHSD
jgi:hypothetical protein